MATEHAGYVLWRALVHKSKQDLILRNFLNIQALMCVALMSILYSVETSSRSVTQLETYPQVSN